jgi:hypothetical protein
LLRGFGIRLHVISSETDTRRQFVIATHGA